MNINNNLMLMILIDVGRWIGCKKTTTCMFKTWTSWSHPKYQFIHYNK